MSDDKPAYVPPLAVELSGRVRAEMVTSGITQAMLARRVGASAKHVNRVLNGHDDGSLPFWDAMLREAARPRELGEYGNQPAAPSNEPHAHQWVMGDGFWWNCACGAATSERGERDGSV